jgi:CTP synthase (UTP-ammonia lyase)
LYTDVMKDIFILGDRNINFVTHRELDAAIELMPKTIRARWVGTDTAEATRTADADGLWVVSGSPYRDDGAVYSAIRMSRTSGQPFLGTCSGFQYAVVDFARNVAGIADADHAETASGSGTLVVDRLACSLVGVERQVRAVPGTRMHRLCGDAPFVGFHWCNFGMAPAYTPLLTEHGLAVSAVADDAGVEAVELSGHPFFLATLFQPQVGCAANQRLHAVIEAFLAAT